MANNPGDLKVMLVLVASMITSAQLLISSTKCVYIEATCGLVLSMWLSTVYLAQECDWL